jgi:hypothetical protein
MEQIAWPYSHELKESFMKRLVALLFAICLTACVSRPSEKGITTPYVITAEESTVVPEGVGTSFPMPTPGLPTFVPTQLKYRVLEEFPDFFFCDPDYYPIAREDEIVLAQQRFPELQANQEEFQAILSHTGLSGTTTFTDEQKLSIYREHKRLNAIYFEPAGDEFKFQIQTGIEGQQGIVITATIDGSGSIDVLQSEDSFPSCPICLAAGTLIGTPRGAISVEDLKVGDQVWTATESGERVAAVIMQLGSVRVPASHQVIHITLKDGRELWASAGHPTSDGRIFADLKLHDMLDGAQIVSVEYLQYEDTYTFDILPSGATGFYWANGILLGSTLQNDR